MGWSVVGLVGIGGVRSGCSKAISVVRAERLGASTSLKAPNHDDAALGTRLAGHFFGLDAPIFSGFSQFSVYILSLGEQADGAARDQRKGLIAQGFQRRQGPRRHDMHRFLQAFPKFLSAFLMDLRRHAGDAHRLAQERRLFAIAFNEMDHGART